MTAPSRDRGLGRGVAKLIPPSPAAPAEQAVAALAALSSVPVQVGVLQAAVVLLDATACRSDDDQLRSAAESTVAHLRKAMEPTGSSPEPHASGWFAGPTPRAPE
ncbi:hypothetical protein HYE82_08630 [Streptomyces sp. BR123]|uniref:hypothetical protein n=1 Tax=Streptomyces sp. BR123 TaxID=2749828 RepID=UPI0015C4B190|nr:hypothetical protein [Streptomyces sp. BR123]NXY94456.1 hypothetical protein [Streptomyces sp. BR123]